MQPGAALMTLTRLDGLVVTVGIEPGARQRASRRDVHLTARSGGGAIAGRRAAQWTRMLNPKTRLIDADVSSVPANSVIAGEAFRADITVGQFKAGSCRTTPC